MTQYIGLLGHPLTHSISPAFQQAALDHLGLSARYEAWPTPPDQLAKAAERLRRSDCLGAGVTIPHKEAMLRLVDEVDPLAKSIGAINTVVNRKGRLTGYNTDAAGFLRALREKGGFDPRDRRVLLLGAGGAARAAAFTLVRENVRSLIIANRNPVRGMNLARDVDTGESFVTAVLMEPDSLRMHVRNADLIVNSTSMGMTGGDADAQSPLKATTIPSTALVFDMVYNPPETPLMRQAREAGAKALGGLPMLVYQAAEQFPMWTGKDAPVDVMFKAGEAALKALAAQKP
ncbi:MAG: shikimate dehydrogenase [SAR202 cluster bacterium]|nr:shikimate dehydrogenase [SAR202 cluster bacterium]